MTFYESSTPPMKGMTTSLNRRPILESSFFSTTLKASVPLLASSTWFP